MHDEQNLIYVLSILEAIEKIKIYSSDFEDADDFLWSNQQLNFNGTVNLLIAIGEETKKIEAQLKEKFAHIKWSAIAGMRDKLSHDYRGIDPNIVWNVIQNELDNLKETLIQMLKKIKYDPKILDEVLKTQYYNHLGYLKTGKNS